MEKMGRSSCINCTKIFDPDTSVCQIKDVAEKLQIIYRHCNIVPGQTSLALCNNCYSTFNQLFNSRLLFCSQTHPNSKINRIRRPNDTHFNATAISATLTQSNSCRENEDSDIEIIDLEEEDETERILPLDYGKEDTDTDEVQIIESSAINVSDHVDRSIITLSTPIEYQEMFLEVKVKDYMGSTFIIPTISGWNVAQPKFTCRSCGRLFSSLELLNSHRDSAHAIREYKFSCQLCNKKFFHHWFLKNHLDACHPEIEILFSCLICEKRFKTKEELEEHKTLHKRPFKCKYCHVAYECTTEVKFLRKHLIECHKDTPEAQAAAFNEKYLQERNTRRPLKAHVSRPCSECGKLFETEFACCVHVIFDHYQKKSCQTCNEEFSSSNDLLDHVEKSEHQQTSCSVCPRQFKNLNNLLKHMDMIHNPNMKYPFVCESCCKSFRFFEQLHRHYITHVIIAGPPKHNCKECGKRFKLKYNFVSHMRTHFNILPDFECNICNKQFRQQSGLIRHNSEVHPTSGVSVLHKCPQCEFTTDTAIGISMHRRSHIETENKPIRSEYIEVVNGGNAEFKNKRFKCSKCDELFVRRDKVCIHLYLLHSILVPGFQKNKIKYQWCKPCKKLYFSKTLYKKHMVTHTQKSKGQRFKCTMCSKKCNGVEETRDHFIASHPGTEEADRSVKNECRLTKDSKTTVTQRTCSQTDIYCVYCKKMFSSISEKDKHDVKVHKALHVCKLCQQICPDEISFKDHEETHKEFRCVVCDLNILSLQGFYEHLQSEHVRYPYICEFCGMYISTLGILMKHYTRKH